MSAAHPRIEQKKMRANGGGSIPFARKRLLTWLTVHYPSLGCKGALPEYALLVRPPFLPFPSGAAQEGRPGHSAAPSCTF